MPFSIPTLGTPAREALGADLSAVAEILNPANAARLPVRFEAKRNARRFFKANPAAKAIFVIVMNSSNDERHLVKIGPRGGCTKVWNFGDGQ